MKRCGALNYATRTLSVVSDLSILQIKKCILIFYTKADKEMYTDILH
jgi:hypothetical protein